MTSIDFATFCCAKDAHRLHAPGQLRRQVESNGYRFNKIIVVHQLCNPFDYDNPLFEDCGNDLGTIEVYVIDDLDSILHTFGIDLNRPQYQSTTDKAHTWKNHVVNHLRAVSVSGSDYIVFADADCWMVRQPDSWVIRGIDILQTYHNVFIVSPNDGEAERATQIISQQMFMARTEDFRNADFNQPGWDGDVTKHSEMPEYHGMLEGRIHHYCKHTGRYRYVLGPAYRYIHHNRLTEDGMFDTDYKKLGWV